MSDSKKSRVLIAARSVFLHYGYRRVNMNDIASAAGVSRPALYLLFKNKEEIFLGVIGQWIDETIADVGAEMATVATPRQKLDAAFEVWAIRPFEMMMTSAEAKELIDCNFDFAQPTLRQGYDKFEATIAPALASIVDLRPAGPQMIPARAAHVIANAVRGFKQAASTPDELRQLIGDLLALATGTDHAGAP